MFWIAGFSGVLVWSLLGHLALARVARRAKPIASSGVPVALSADISAPVTWGWLRPMILLPIEAEAWPAERREAALQHELAHVSRFDYLIQLLARLVCAVYWFHPLVWYAMRRLRAESEHACDDRVITAGMAAPDYASHLLAVAGGAVARRHGAMAALAMARPSQFESRLLAVLDETRRRGTVSRRIAIAVALVVVCVLLPLAAARPELRAATMEPLRETTNVVRPIREAFREARNDLRDAMNVVKVKDKKHDNGPSFTVDHVAPASPGETLHFDLPTGGFIEILGWDEPRVTVQALMRGRDAADCHVTLTRAEDGVRLHSVYKGSNPSYSTSLGFVVRAPRRINVQLSSAGGGLTLTDLEGTFTGTTGGGSLIFDRVKGTAEVSTGGGTIEVTDSNLEGEVSTGGGGVTFTRVSGGLQASSGSGPIVRTDGDSNAPISIEQAGGEIDLDEAPKGATVSTGGGDIEIGRGAGLVRASTGGGDIRIGPVAGSVRAGTGAGNVDISVVDANGAVQNVVVTTGSGRVVLHLPATLDARLELEASYTEGHSARIESDWPLERDPLTGWDDHEGTARRYVRARGNAGGGRGTVRVKAVNGDVVVRRGQ